MDKIISSVLMKLVGMLNYQAFVMIGIAGVLHLMTHLRIFKL